MPFQIENIGEALALGSLEAGTHYQLRGDWKTVPTVEWLEMLNSTPMPTDVQIETWVTQEIAKQATEGVFILAQSGLKDKIALAKTYASDIKTLWNACLDQLENNSSHPTRFNNVLAAVNALPTALKNRVNKGTADPALAITDILKDAYVDHVLLIATSLAMLLSQK